MNSGSNRTPHRDTSVRIDLFNSEVSSIQTTVYARVHVSDAESVYRLSGTIRGPYSLNSQTLPASFRLTDCGPGETALARTCITDPCAWSPSLPAVYRVELCMDSCGETIHKLNAQFGIRDFTTNQRSLIMSGKRVVLRGVGSQRTNCNTVADWHVHNAAMLVDNPDESLCQQATDHGVVICARLTGDESAGTVSLREQIRRLAVYPCVNIIWIENASIDATITQVAPNVLLAVTTDDTANREIADVLIWRINSPADVAPPTFGKPIMALRPIQAMMSLAAARSACDQLQRDLAPQCDLAGYFV